MPFRFSETMKQAKATRIRARYSDIFVDLIKISGYFCIQKLEE